MTALSRPRAALARLAALALVASPLALVPFGAPSPAAAAGAGGSIVFIKDHDVWIAAGDGSGARPLTTAGSAALPYRAPSQSDTGVIVATRYQTIEVLDQQGRLLREIDPPALTNSLSHPVDGTPYHLSISPDGRTIAFTHASHSCTNGCGLRTATGYVRTDGSPSQLGTSYFQTPSWIGNARTLQSGGFGSHAMLHDLGASTQQLWFNASDDLGNLEVSPDGTMVAGVLGDDDFSRITTFAIAGNVLSGPPPDVTPHCDYWDEQPLRLTDPTWSPDSGALAWSEVTGIWVALNPKEPVCNKHDVRQLIAGGSQPDWSAAPLSAPLPKAAKLKNVGKPRVVGVARVGKTLKAKPGEWKPAAKRVSFQWLRNGKPVKGASKKRYKLTKRDAGRRVAVRVTATRSGMSGTAVSAAKKVRR